MFIVVCYDIVSDSRRRKVQKAMEDYGRRVQYSVFECDLDDEALAKLKRRLKPLLSLREDSVRYYTLCEGDVRKVRVTGVGEVKRPEPYRIV